MTGEREHSPGLPMQSSDDREPSLVRALSIALLLAGILIVPTAWLIAADATHSRAGWMALLLAANSVALLRLAGYPPVRSRVLLSTLLTAAGIGASQWLISAWPIGAALGQMPVTAGRNMGADFAWTIMHLGSSPADWICLGAALLLAGWLAR